MSISRRNLLWLVAGTFLSQVQGAQQNAWQRRYRASATITLLSIPIFSRNDVGSGFILIEEADRKTAIQFGAGLWPENARGLNRLGVIQEIVSERNPGEPAECEYFAFMTTSNEKSIEQAKRALEASGPVVPYAVVEAAGKHGSFASKLDRVNLSSRITWRDYPQLTDQVRAAVKTEDVSQHPVSQNVAVELPAGEAAPATFLYSVRKALMSTNGRSNARFIYNGKQFLLRTDKERDAAMGARFAEKNLVPDPSRVMRLNARLEACATGELTPFKVWYESGRENLPPLRFEYQAKSFLRLAFEFDPAAAGPPVSHVLNNLS